MYSMVFAVYTSVYIIALEGFYHQMHTTSSFNSLFVQSMRDLFLRVEITSARLNLCIRALPPSHAEIWQNDKVLPNNTYHIRDLRCHPTVAFAGHPFPLGWGRLI